jgi:2,3-bisphosphoglycerate-dependent phosphoglycerate mutase
MSEINLIFIRHGEAAESWGEHPDPGLSENGISQSQKLISNPSLQSLENFMFISSPKSRAKMTAAPILKKYNKKLIIDNHFSEIPSSNIKASEKREWLKKVLTMNISDLPQEVLAWRDGIISKTLSFTNNTIIFSHFMVINTIVSGLIKHSEIMHFYPDYTSVTQITLKNNKPIKISLGDEKKTVINL